MGTQCSSEVRRQSSVDEDDVAASPWPVNTDTGNPDAVSGMCGGAFSRRFSHEVIDGKTVEHVHAHGESDELPGGLHGRPGGPGSGADAEPRAAQVAKDGREVGRFDGEDDAFNDQRFVRWAQPCAGAEEDRIHERDWVAMMANLDQFITPLAPLSSDNAGGGGSSGSTSTARGSGCRPIGEEAQREAAFAALQEGRPLYTLPEALRADKEVVLAAIGAEGQYCYDYIASRELRERDHDVVFALVARDGSLLANCSEELRADRQLVRLALQTCSSALSCAAAPLQGDKELKAYAAARAKEETRSFKQFEEKVTAKLAQCGPR